MSDTTTTVSPRLDAIAAHGNQHRMRPPYDLPAGAEKGNWITCVDGFKVSVLAGEGAYCDPRPGWLDDTPADYSGPYTEVEVGFPSEKPEPWEAWRQHIDDGGPDCDPCESVYPYVPVELVRHLIALHGGEK